jgi:hypothetical protein
MVSKRTWRFTSFFRNLFSPLCNKDIAAFFDAYCTMLVSHKMLFVSQIYPTCLLKYSGFSKACAKFKYPAESFGELELTNGF